MSEVKGQSQDQSILIAMSDLGKYKSFVANLPATPNYLEELSFWNAHYHDAQVFTDTPPAYLDEALIQLISNHLTSTCELGFKTHTILECMTHFVQFWQETFVFNVSQEHKIELNGLKMFKADNFVKALAARCELILENLDIETMFESEPEATPPS